ncbi:restriction endonuclease subunit S [Lactobacillus equicursoris]|uniref:restriction endonuclease subunit S n=1 Tax=Lactobacillus equicursoris TaxID=420645 RepID=UPI0039942424
MTKRDAKDEKKAPKLRFKGFTDDWEHGHLGDIVKIVMGQSPSSINYTDNPEDHILVQGNADLENGHVVPRVWTKQVTKTADKDDIILSVRAPVGDVGITNYPIVIGRGVAAIKGNKFIYQLLDKMNQDSFWRKYSTGSTFESINSNDLKKAEIFHPNEPEQEKIGKLFQSLDRAIYLHEEKRKQLEQLKKALLQKMFADKTNFPEIRFNGYVGPWEQVKFGKITSKYKTRNKDGEQLRSFSVSNIYGFIPQEEQFENGGIALNADKKNSIIVTPNSFAYNPARINVGSIGYYNGNENVLVSSLYEVFKLHKEYDPNYLWFWLKSNHFNWWIHRLQEGSVRSYFYYDKFSEIKERMPSLPEQMKIGQLLKSLDHTITLHDQKIEDLKQLKQALLQQMFI